MKWIKKQSSFKYDNRTVTRTTMICDTPLGQFKVYEAVGGKVFYQHPFIETNWRDPEGTFGRARFPSDNLEDGIAKCEAKWAQVKEAVNAV